MNYKEIQGWFDFEDVYREAVSRAKHGDVFLELGCHRGKSTVFMLDEIESQQKVINFICVDIWEDDEVLKDFLRNTHKRQFQMVKADSCSLDLKPDFCFIDTEHDYETINREITYWKGKAKTIGGHDYSDTWPGVKKAVGEHFGEDFKIIGNSWIHGW